MKKHSVSRIRLIRHPSPANTHQSPRAHDLITKCTATAKQPGNFNGAPLMQTRRWQLFLLPGTWQLEDCGRRWEDPSASECYNFHDIHRFLVVPAWFQQTQNKSQQLFLWLYYPELTYSMFCFFFFERDELVDSQQRRRFHFKKGDSARLEWKTFRPAIKRYTKATRLVPGLSGQQAGQLRGWQTAT